jgi:ABC-type phosphate transport system substrate-binding protein
MKRLVVVPFLALLAGLCAGFSADDTIELAVVVNKSNPLDTITTADLRSMILGEKSKWPDGKKVTAVETPPESRERALMLKDVCKMSEAVLKRYFMQAAFTGKDVAQPQDVASAAALKQFVGRTPGAVGFILASEADETVKVLKVDGMAPGEPGYKLR